MITAFDFIKANAVNVKLEMLQGRGGWWRVSCEGLFDERVQADGATIEEACRAAIDWVQIEAKLTISQLALRLDNARDALTRIENSIKDIEK